MKKIICALVALFIIPVSVSAQDMKSDSDDGNVSEMMVKPQSSFFDLTGLGSQVREYTSEKAARKLARQHIVVYFFAAAWCPTCRATYEDIRKNHESIPPDVIIIFVNYDNSDVLKMKYGITMQHSYVQIGPNGEKIRAWSGSQTVANIVNYVKR
ncbi:MAG TPA: thioredoxin family protein [Spirochaetota bacterium]